MSAGPPHAPRVRNKQTTIPSINIQIIVYTEAGGSRHFSKLSSFMRAMKLEALSCGKIVLSAGDVSETEWRTAQVDRHTSRRVMARLAHSFLFRCTPRHYLSPRRSLGEDDDSVSRGGERASVDFVLSATFVTADHSTVGLVRCWRCCCGFSWP